MDIDDDEAAAFFMIAYFVFLAIILSCVFICGPIGYYMCRVANTEQKRLRPGDEVHPATKGGWKHGLFEICSDFGGFLCSCCCLPCVISDLSLRAGWTHEIMGETTQPSVAYFANYYFMQCCQFCFGDAAKCLFLTMFAFLRSGLSTDAAGKVFGRLTSHKARFQLQEDDATCMDGVKACLTWGCCGPCAAHQELRQVKAAMAASAPQQAQVVPPHLPPPLPHVVAPMPPQHIMAQVVSVQGPPQQLQQPLMPVEQYAQQPQYAPQVPLASQAMYQHPPQAVAPPQTWAPPQGPPPSVLRG